MRRKMLFAAGVLTVAAIHFLFSFFVSFAAGTGGGLAYKLTSQILTFPLWLIPGSATSSSPFDWLPWVLLSLAWGIVICYFMRFVSGANK